MIPAYNCEATVADAIESCLTQTYGDVEVIVVNDGSTDGTLDVLRTFGSRITVLSQPNRGVGAARNAGTRAASGEYVALMDSDDIAVPDRLRFGARVLASRPDIVLVSSDFSAFLSGEGDYEPSHVATYYHSVNRLGGMARIYPDVAMVVDAEDRTADPLRFRYGDVYASLVWGNFVHPPTVMMRHSVFDSVGGFDETQRYSTEYDLIIRIARTSRCAYIEQPLLRYRHSAAQLSHEAGGGLVPLGNLAVLESIERDDPAFHSANRRRFDTRRAESLVAAALGMAASDRRRALGLLIRSLRFRLHTHGALRAFAHIVAPRSAITAIRGVKRAFASGSA